MATTAGGTAKLNVFISYSRDDIEFADQLAAALGLQAFNVTLDRHGISGGEDWKVRLGALIRDADTIVFVLTPASARSDVCRWEAEEATRLGKRIIPVPCRPLESTAPPQQLAGLNYIHFYAEPRVPGSGFGTGLVSLVTALNTDLDWLREHTRLLQRAVEWEAGGKPANRLLTGSDIGDAKAWATRRPKEAPEPTLLHMEFLRASESAEAEKQSTERQRLAERERLLQDAEAAQAARARALTEAADAQRRRGRLRNALLAVMSVAALGLGFAGYFAWDRAKIAETERGKALAQAAEAHKQSVLAKTEEEKARTAKERADKSRDEALLTQSKFLSDRAMEVLERDKDPGTAALLALEALRDEKSDDEVTRTRPLWPKAHVALDSAMRQLRERPMVERQLLIGHAGGVRSVAVMPDGAGIVSGGEDRTVRLWRRGTDGAFAETAVLRGHTSRVRSVAVSADGTTIVSAANDRTVRIWLRIPGESFAEGVVLHGHTQVVNEVDISPDGAIVASGSVDKTVRLWRRGDDGTFTPWTELKAHESEVNSVRFANDGALLASGDNTGVIRLWRRAPDGTFGVWVSMKGHEHAIWRVQFSPDSSTLASSAFDSAVRLWRLGSDGLTPFATLDGHAEGSSITFSTEGSVLASGDGAGAVRIWRRMANGNFAIDAVLKGHEQHVMGLAYAPDGSFLVSAGIDGTMRIWQTPAPSSSVQSATLKGHGRAVTSVAFTHDSTTLASGSMDGQLRIWRRGANDQFVLAAEINQASAIQDIALSPASDMLATAASDGVARLWLRGPDGSYAQAAELKGHAGAVYSLSISADGSLLASAGQDRTVRLWRRKANGGYAEGETLKGHEGTVVGRVAFTRDSGLLASGGSDRTIRFWQRSVDGSFAHSATLLGHERTIFGLAFAPDGQTLASCDDRTVRLWQRQQDGRFAETTAHKLDADALGLAFSADGAVLAVSAGNMIKLLRRSATDQVEEVAVLKGHTDNVLGLAFSPDGSMLASGDHDAVIRLWPLLVSGQALIKEAKQQVRQCLTETQRMASHLPLVPPAWCESLQKWPYDPHATANWHAEAKRWRQAVSAFEAAIVREPQRVSLRVDLGQAHGALAWAEYLDVAMRGKSKSGLSAVIEHADKSVALAADIRNMVSQRGHMLLALGRIEAARADFEKAISLGMTTPGPYMGMGRVKDLQGDRDGAIADYRRALDARAANDWQRHVHKVTREHLAALGVTPPEAK